jgi:diguanylate cyclase (GGDEF)-like protein
MHRSGGAAVVYYGICAGAITLLALVGQPDHDSVAVVVGLALFAAVAGVRTLFMRRGQPATLQVLAYLLFFTGFVLLRNATGKANSVLLPIVLLPVVAAALHGTLRQLSIVVAAVFATLTGPPLVLGDPDPAATLRGALIWAVLAGCLGFVVHGLVAGLADRDREQRALLAVVERYGIIHADRTGRIVAVNDGARVLLGLAPGALLPPGTDLAQLAHGGTEGLRDEVRAEALHRGQAHREFRWTNLAGAQLTIDLTVATKHDPRGRLTGWTVFVLDVTAAATARATAARSELRWRTLVENLPETIVLVADEDLRYQLATGAGLDRMGLTEAAGRTLPEVFGEVLGRQLEPAYRQALAGEASRTEFTLESPDGPLAIAMVATPLPAEAGHGPRQALVLGFDVSEQRRHEEALSFLADHDPLTGLANRRRFDADLVAHLDACGRGTPRGAVLTLDLDQFKAINDTLGHSVGDQVIVATAELLRRRLRAEDVVARLGGDEFAILLREVDPGEAATVAGDIVQAVREHAFVVDGSPPRHTTVSVGVVPIVGPTRTAPELMATADLTMYDAKESGRDTWMLCESGSAVQPRMAARLEWAERIGAALAHDGFVFHAQPIRSLHTGRVEGAELLLRMLDDAGELVVPGRFLHVAEQVGLITEIDALAVERAVEILARVQAERPDFNLAVNISGQSVGNAALVRRIAAAVERTGADGSGLVLEITETVAIPDFAVARTFVDELRGFGIRFALDDFGAGFGSLAYLRELRFDYLKIDGAFVVDCVANENDRMIIAAIVALSRGLGTETIAEFVTDAAVLEVVRGHGVDHVQGYHVGAPVPLDTLLDTLALADREAVLTRA